MVYREIIEGDNPNKGRYQGCCNRRQCMRNHSERTPITFFNFGTGSYYCVQCARMLNNANPDSFSYYGISPVCQNLNPAEVVAVYVNAGKEMDQTVENLYPKTIDSS